MYISVMCDLGISGVQLRSGIAVLCHIYIYMTYVYIYFNFSSVLFPYFLHDCMLYVGVYLCVGGCCVCKQMYKYNFLRFREHDEGVESM